MMVTPAAKSRKFLVPMPDNTILDQKDRRQCFMFATAGNAYEHLTGVSFNFDQIMALWAEMVGADAKNKGTDPRAAIKFCVSKGFFRNDVEMVYDHKMQPRKSRFVIERIRKAYASPDETVLFVLQCKKIEKGPLAGQKLPTDSVGVMYKVEDDWGEAGEHLVHSGGYFHPEKFYATHFDIENSWSEEYGDHGHAGLPISRFLEYVRTVFIVKAPL